MQFLPLVLSFSPPRRYPGTQSFTILRSLCFQGKPLKTVKEHSQGTAYFIITLLTAIITTAYYTAYLISIIYFINIILLFEMIQAMDSAIKVKRE